LHGTLDRGELTTYVDITKNVDMNRNYLRAIPREWRTISRALAMAGESLDVGTGAGSLVAVSDPAGPAARAGLDAKASASAQIAASKCRAGPGGVVCCKKYLFFIGSYM